MRSGCSLGFVGLLLLVSTACDDTLFGVSEDGAVQTYEADWDGVVEMLDDNCATCHFEGGSLTSVILLPDDLEADLADGEGEFIVAGDPDASVLVERLTSESSPMPPAPNGPLDPLSIEHVLTWIENGAEIQ